MAYSRNYRSRRRRPTRYRPRRKYNKASAVNLNSVANTAYQAWKYGKLAMSLINTETKHHETDTAPTSIIPNTWLQYNLASVVQGDTEFSRDGGKIRAKTINLRIQLVRAAANTVVLNQVRCALVHCLTGDAVPDDVYSPLNGNTIVAPRNLAAASKYKVLWDKTYNFTKGNNEGTLVNKFHNIDEHISYPPSSSTPEKSQYMLIITSGAVSATDYTTAQVFTRLGFIDN